MLQSVDYSTMVMPMHNVPSVSSLRSATASHPTLHTSSLPQDLQGSSSSSKDHSSHFHSNTQPAFHSTYHHSTIHESAKHQNDQYTASTPRSFFHTETKHQPKQQNDQPVQLQHNQSSVHHPQSEIDATALESLLEISKPRPSSPRSPGSPSSRSALMSSSPSLSSSSSSECLHDVLPDSPSPAPPTEFSGEVSKDLSAGSLASSKPNPSENDAAAALLFMKKSDSGLNLHLLVSGQKRGSDDDMKISSSSDSIMTLGNNKAPVAKRVKRHCVKCGKTNEKTWRRGPTGEPNYCNACGVRWSRQQKKDEQLRNSSDRSKLPRSFSAPSLDLSSGFSSDGGSSGNSINIPMATPSPASIRASCDNIPRMIGEISVRDHDDLEAGSE